MDERHVVDRLQNLQRTLLTREPLRHSIVAVERGDGSFRWSGAIGEAQPGGAAMQPDTPYFIASIDKLFTATVAMLLTEQGSLTLDAPVSTCVGPSLARGLHRMSGVDHSDRLTVRHLLSHSSGLPDWLEDCPPGGRSFVDQVLTGGDRAISLGDIMAIVREIPPHFAPAEPSAARPRIRYSDTNFILLGAVIEAVTGEPLSRVHERLLFRPLTMNRTWFAGRSSPVDPVDAPAALYAEGQPCVIPQLMQSFGGIYSTVTDQFRFMRGLIRGGIFANPATFQLMQHWNRFGIPLDKAALRQPGWPIEYGFGLMRFRLPRVFTRFRPLPAVIGHSGSTGTWLFYCAEWDLLFAGTVDDVSAGAVPYRAMPKTLEIFRAMPPSRP